jgi:hypothetical protein
VGYSGSMGRPSSLMKINISEIDKNDDGMGCQRGRGNSHGDLSLRRQLYGGKEEVSEYQGMDNVFEELHSVREVDFDGSMKKISWSGLIETQKNSVRPVRQETGLPDEIRLLDINESINWGNPQLDDQTRTDILTKLESLEGQVPGQGFDGNNTT